MNSVAEDPFVLHNEILVSHILDLSSVKKCLEGCLRHNLITDHLGIAGVSDNLMQESALLVRFGELLDLILWKCQSVSDIRVHEALDSLDAAFVVAHRKKPENGATKGVVVSN